MLLGIFKKLPLKRKVIIMAEAEAAAVDKLGLGPPEEPDFEESKKLLAQMQEHFVLLMVGCRGSGKTYSCIHLLLNFYRHRFGLIVIVSPTWILQKQCRVIDGEGVIVCSDPNNSEFVLKEIMDMQAELKDTPEQEDVLVIYDDTGVRLKDKQQLNLIDLLTRGRHSKVSIMMLVQRMTYALTTARSQADGVLFWAEENPNERKLIFMMSGFDPEGQLDLDRKMQQRRFFRRFDQYTKEQNACAFMVKHNQHWSMHPFQCLTPKQQCLEKKAKADKKDSAPVIKKPKTSAATPDVQSSQPARI